MAAITMVICGACTLAGFLYFRCKERFVPSILLKISTSVFFLFTALAATLALPAGELHRMLPLCAAILAGQILGMCGDFWLDMKLMYPQHKEPYVFAGFASFMMGHLFFIAGLIAVYGIDLQKLLICLGAGIALLAAVLLMEKPMKLKYGKFKGVAAGLCVIFGVVIALAFQSAFSNGAAVNMQALIMAIGLLLFLASDLVLSGTYFGKGKDRPVDYTLNYLFYYGAQFTIALSLLA